MNRLTITLAVEYDGELDPLKLTEEIEEALDTVVGRSYGTVQYQNHTIEYEVQDGDN